MKQKQDGAKRKMQAEKSKKNTLNENEKRINEGIETIKVRMKIANNLLKSWQSALKEVRKMETVKKFKLLYAHFQVVTGNKRKIKLEEKFYFLNTKLPKLN